MKTVVGVKTFAEAETMLRLGADELYGGYAEVPNHRLPSQSFQTLAELKAAVRLAKAAGKKFSLLLNQPCFGPKYDEALGAAAELDREGLGACIVRELPMLEKLNALKLRAKLTVSSLALCFNLPAMRRYRELGASRVVLPFQLTPEEAAPLLKNRLGLETEVFFHGDFCCVNVDPACRLWSLKHVIQTCRYTYCGRGGGWKMPEANAPEKMRSVYGFYHGGAGYLKMVRMENFSDEIEVFKFARMLTELLKKGPGEEDFVRMGEKLYSTVSRHAWKKR